MGFKSKRWIMVIGVATCLTVGTVVSANFMLRQDEINYPYKEDATVMGAWRTVDFVEEKEDFKPGMKIWQGREYLRQMTFLSCGALEMMIEEGNQLYPISGSDVTWTKGRVLNAVDATDSLYTIESIDGKDYLFYEWKSGDYTLRGMKPQYYVLERVTDESKAMKVEAQGKVDEVDLPFVSNKEMLGTWQSVDFVEQIDEFNPSELQWKGGEFYLKGCQIDPEGKVGYDFGEGIQYYDVNSWTGDVLISTVDQTASKCTIKDIDGQTYMFREWKSGDYTIRGMSPYYYVLKKIDKKTN